MKSASGSGILPALWAQSASSSDPAASHARSDVVERLDHAGLVIDMLDRDQRRTLGQFALEHFRVDQPVAHRPGAAPALGPIAATTASCSVGPREPVPAPCARAAAIAIASLAPEVRMTS